MFEFYQDILLKYKKIIPSVPLILDYEETNYDVYPIFISTIFISKT